MLNYEKITQNLRDLLKIKFLRYDQMSKLLIKVNITIATVFILIIELLLRNIMNVLYLLSNKLL